MEPLDAATGRLQACLDEVRSYAADDTDLALLDQLRAMEELVCAARAAQSRATAAFVTSRREAADRARDDDRAAGIGPRVADRRRRQAEAAITAEVALARRVSPHRAARQIGLAHAVSEMPRAKAAFDRGDLTEWQATILARETACLTVEERGQVDAEIAALPGGAGGLGPKKLEATAKKIAYRLDPYATTKRAAKAAADRRVTLRPAPDTMTLLTALLPVKDGVACHAQLSADADQARAAGDERGRGQLMADLLVERLTGTTPATPTTIEIELVMSTDTFLDGHDHPAHLPGYGPVPAPVARQWITDPAAQVFLRRLFTRPADGSLIAMDSRRRLFPDGLHRLVMLRDDVCRTPGCEAPIRHLDHVTDAAHGGATSWVNAQGLCERCNHAKQAAGWRSIALGEGVVTTTPTGWTCTSPIPPPVVTTRHPLRASSPPDDDWLPPLPDTPPDPPPWLGPDGLADFILIA